MLGASLPKGFYPYGKHLAFKVSLPLDYGRSAYPLLLYQKGSTLMVKHLAFKVSLPLDYGRSAYPLLLLPKG